MTIDRRSGAPSTFTWLLGLALGATCAAMTPACSASSGAATPGGWGQSGGGPLGADQSSSGGGSGGGVGGDGDASPTQPTGGNDAAPGTAGDAGASGDATTGGGDGGVVATDAAGDSPGEGSVTTADFTLLDTAITTVVDGSPVAGFDPIAEDATINLATVGSALSIRANTVPALVGSVAFALDATYTHTENTAPYTLCSDNGLGTVTSCASILVVGKHTLTATPYSAASLGGDAGAPITLTFTIVDIATDAGATDAGDAGVKDAGGQ